MRLFTGIALPDQLSGTLGDLIARLRPHAAIRWSRAENLHITTKFIGEWPPEKIEDLKAALSRLPAREPIRIEVRGLGWFPNPYQPRIFWAAVHAGPELARLSKDTEDVLESLGVAREERSKTSHLTLARTHGRDGRRPPDLAALRRAVDGLASLDFGVFQASEFHLYISHSGAYTRLATFPVSVS